MVFDILVKNNWVKLQHTNGKFLKTLKNIESNAIKNIFQKKH